MSDSSLKRLVMVAIAVAVVIGAAAGVMALLGSISGKVGSAPWEAGQLAVDESRSFPLGGVQSIVIEAVSSDVTVREGPQGQVSAHLQGTVRSSQEDRVPKLVAEAKGSTVEIRVEHPTTVIGFFTERTRLDIELPRGYGKALKVTSVSGEIDLDERTLGRLEIATTSGDVKLGAVKAESVEVRTVSGDFVAEEISSKTIALRTTSGDFKAEGLSGDLEASSVSGELAFGWLTFSGRARIGSTSGEVKVRLPAGASFELDAKTTSGDISCAFSLTRERGSGDHALAGKVGSGGGSLVISTVSGDIEVGK